MCGTGLIHYKSLDVLSDSYYNNRLTHTDRDREVDLLLSLIKTHPKPDRQRFQSNSD